MLTGNDFSAFHRLHNMTEIWYYHAGERLNLYVIDTDGILAVHHLYANNEMQVVIQPGQWFAADIPSKSGFCLVGCAVAPAFSFENFVPRWRCFTAVYDGGHELPQQEGCLPEDRCLG